MAAGEAGWQLETLKGVAAKLQKDLDDLTSNVPVPALVGPDALGDYPAAKGLGDTFANAHGVTETTYNAFKKQYQELIDTLNGNIKNYSAADDATTQAANHVHNWTT